MNFFARHTLTELYMLEHSDCVYLHGSTMLNTSLAELGSRVFSQYSFKDSSLVLDKR